MFEGRYLTEIICENCKNSTKTEEPFLDLSIDIEKNTSISFCITN